MNKQTEYAKWAYTQYGHEDPSPSIKEAWNACWEHFEQRRCYNCKQLNSKTCDVKNNTNLFCCNQWWPKDE